MIPKYRAWDKHGQKMFVNDELIIWNGNVYANDSKKLTCNNLKGWSIDDEYLMQSTGFKDKNGKEIFEGDIVRQVRTQPITENETITGVVIMIEGAWLIMNDCEQLASYLWSETDENEIIGNVYENTELLEAIK
ncbi:YopX family protein [Streptococcus mitis]|uniref:YopX family protein n=1 Tax=Streptococcus mitis TaxID=28037 RepID=UPI00200078A8|nr:YopX family protein [Streptococcus mitis]